MLNIGEFRGRRENAHIMEFLQKKFLMLEDQGVSVYVRGLQFSRRRG
jgi:hypothetical protein